MNVKKDYIKANTSSMDENSLYRTLKKNDTLTQAIFKFLYKNIKHLIKLLYTSFVLLRMSVF